MFGIGMPELFVIMAIALIVIGPKKLPDLARSIGRALGEFKKATGELKSSLGVDEELSDVKNAFDDINQDIKDAVNVNPLTTSGNKAAPTDSNNESPENGGTTNPDSETSIKTNETDNSEADGTAPTATDTNDMGNSTKFAVKNDKGATAGDE